MRRNVVFSSTLVLLAAVALVIVGCVGRFVEGEQATPAEAAPAAPPPPPPSPAFRGELEAETEPERLHEFAGHEPQLSDSLAQGGADELWVLVRESGRAGATEGTPIGLRTTDPARDEEVPLPLRHTDVHARILGSIATVTVEQRYENPFDRTIEVEYVFPLPDDAAVSEFVMIIGERRIRGVIREREEAEAIYREARRQGYRASLLTEERPNVFTQRVANIEPSARIDIRLTYFNRLPHVDGAYELAFPVVVGPRYNPAGSRDGVGAVARDAIGSSGQATEVAYLRPGERSGHDISLTVDLDAGAPLAEVVCTTHAVEIDRRGASAVTVRLADRAVIPDRDFVLRYSVASDPVAPALFRHEDASGGYFSLELHPPADLERVGRSPRELIFVIDTSGSMSGVPLDIARRAVADVLQRMGPDDTFQIIRFSNDTSSFGPAPVPATPENVARGLGYLRALAENGGTEMLRGIRAALDFPHEPRRLRLITFLTDGFIGNEAEILAEIERGLGSSRIFSFGIGSSPNRFLLDRMAYVGRGAVAYIGEDRRLADEVVDSFYERIAHPALAEIEIEWNGLLVTELYPSRVPDLFPGRPVLLTGRYHGRFPRSIQVSGRAEGRVIVIDVPLDAASVVEHPALPNLWARRKITELALRSLAGDDASDLAGEIRQVALGHGLMSAYTAFVAVDASATVDEPAMVTVPVPVAVPHGVSPGTTIK